MIIGASENKAVYIEHLTIVDSPVPQIQTLNNLKRKDVWPETECLAPDGGIIKISTLVFFFCSLKPFHSKQLSSQGRRRGILQVLLNSLQTLE